MNQPSVLSNVQHGSLALRKKSPSAIDPFIFMDKKKIEILHQLEGLECTETEAAQIYLFLKEILTQLKSYRAYKSKTYDYLDEVIKKFPAKIRICAILFLIKALNTDDSWMHAYNHLADFTERYLLHREDPKYMSEVQLLELIKEDEEEPLIFNEKVLEKFYSVFNDGFLWETTTMDVFKNWFRAVPSGNPLLNEEMTTYFCYAVGQIDDYRIKDICPNIENWYAVLTGKKTGFCKLKKQAVGPNKREVDRRIVLLRNLLNG